MNEEAACKQPLFIPTLLLLFCTSRGIFFVHFVALQERLSF